MTCRSTLTSTQTPKSRSIFIPKYTLASYEKLALGYLAVVRRQTER
jgi:hypothetical protein